MRRGRDCWAGSRAWPFAVMQLLGRSNWWLPRRLERWLPELRVEGRPETFLPFIDDAEPIPSPAK